MLEPRCNICKQIKQEYLKDGSSKLERRLYVCAKFVKGGEPQSVIAKEFGFGQVALSKHLKIHQNPDTNILVAEKFERNLEKKANSHQEVRDKLKEAGLQALEDGEMKIPAAVLRGVAKDEADLEERQKDRSLKMAEMIFAFTSGEQGGHIANDTDRIKESNTTEQV